MEDLLFLLFALLRLSLFEILCVTGFLILIGIVLGVIERRADFYVQSILGWKGIMLTAWIGTPVHESGHLLMCYIFRHKIQEFKLFDRKARNGLLGYVKHSWDEKSLYQNIGNFFIGMGPIFSGTAALILGVHFFLPASFATFANYLTMDPNQPSQYILAQIFTLTTELFKSIFAPENLTSASFWIYFAFAIGVSSHIALSKEDLNGARKGLVTMFTLILLANIIALILNINILGFFASFLALNVYLLAFSMVSVVFSLIRLVLSAFAYYAA